MIPFLMQILRKTFFPTYDELHLLAFSFTLILFFVVKFSSIFGVGNFVPETNGMGPLVLALILVTGVVLSLYHAFSRGKLGHYQKLVMFLFASLVNGFSGIWAGTYILSLSEKWTWVLIFPILNIFSSFIILSEARSRVLENDIDNGIDDRCIRLSEVAVSIGIISLVFLITRYYLHMHEMMIFSICVAYGTNLNKVIVNFVVPKRSHT